MIGFYSGLDRVLSGMVDYISDVDGCENDTGGSNASLVNGGRIDFLR